MLMYACVRDFWAGELLEVTGKVPIKLCKLLFYDFSSKYWSDAFFVGTSLEFFFLIL